MTNLYNAKVSFADNVERKKPKGDITLWDALVTKQSEWADKVDKVRKAPKEKSTAIKKALPIFTPSGTFDTINKDGLKAHSGFVCIDIDRKDNENVANFNDFKKLVHKVPHIAYCGLSCSGEGYFCIIPIAKTELHALYYRALVEAFRKCGVKVDEACKDISRKRFVSYDNEPYINTSATPFDLLPGDATPKGTAIRQAEAPEELRAKYDRALTIIEANGWDITDNEMRWYAILSACAHDLGEDGREYAHRLSRFYPGYTAEETDRKFNQVLKAANTAYSLGTVVYWLNETARAHDFDEVQIN